MAQKKKDAPKKDAHKGRKKGKLGFIIIGLTFGASLLFIMPTFVLVMVGMIPTIVSLLTDDDEERSTTICIGALNSVGVMPFVIDLWMKGQTIQSVLTIMMQSTTWVVILGAAGIGKLIVFAVPQATAAIAIGHVERRLKILRDNLTSLKDAWGPDVGTTKSIQNLRQGD